MKEYIPETVEFSESITIPETTDTNHADNINSAPKQLIANTLANKEEIDELKENTEVVEALEIIAKYGAIGNSETYIKKSTQKDFTYYTLGSGPHACIVKAIEQTMYRIGNSENYDEGIIEQSEVKILTAESVDHIALREGGYVLTIIGLSDNALWQKIDYNTLSESSVTETPAIRVKNGMAELKGTFNSSASTPCSFPSDYAPDHEITVVKYDGDYLYTYIVGTDGVISVKHRSIESTQTSPVYINLSGITWMLK